MARTIIPEVLQVDRAIPRLLSVARWRILAVVGGAVAAIALADWRADTLSLAGLYIFPMLLAATVLPAPAIVALSVICAFLRCSFDPSPSAVEYALRFVFSFLTYVMSGLFVMAVMRNRQMALEHIAQLTREQRLRNEAQERLNTLVESSPAAILTLNQQGVVLAANHAAGILFGVQPKQTLEGRSIKPYLPILSEALRLGTAGKPFRTAAQAQGRRASGEIFLADLWFSTYPAAEGTQLAAIVVDSSEELRDREQENQRQLSTSNRLVVGAVLHEIRNLCSAISTVYSNLKEKDSPCRVDEIQGLESLVRGLGRVASFELNGKEQEALDEVVLQDVLDDLRIIIEPGWTEIGGALSWSTPEGLIRVLADRYGLLQVFLNLAQNSHRAVQLNDSRHLDIRVLIHRERALVRFADSGCGVADPRHLFEPFQQGADMTGLGLFVSRALVRSYGGELRFQPAETGCCFAVELALVAS